MRSPVVPIALIAGATLALTLPLGAQDAGQVTKPQPLPSPAGGMRLPAPTGLTVSQDFRGAITVSWSPVAGAVRYNLGRSVGTEGFRQAVPPSTDGTTLVDTRVTAGVRHLYTVTPIDAQGVAGMRATTEAFIPSRSYDPSATTPPNTPVNVVARVEADGAIMVSWTGPIPYNGPGHYEIRRNNVALGRRTMPNLRETGLPPGQYRYEVAATSQYGYMSAWTASNTVTLDATTRVDSGTTAGTTGGSTTGGATGGATGGIAAEDAGGTVLVNVATPVTLRAGATHSLAAVARAGWTSLSPSIASVTADGTVTARAAGVAQLATVGTDASGAVRVTVVRVRVTP